MCISYLQERPWSEWTRDERFFCSALYQCAIADKDRFAGWVYKTAQLDLPFEGPWDVGYEVSFYRDFLWQQGKKPAEFGVSDQRAFDLCLFCNRALVVIEAKVFEAFKSDQNREFAKDKDCIGRLPGMEDVQVGLVALASGIYFANHAEYGNESTLSMFDGRLTWAQAHEEYGVELLAQAESTYKMKPKMC